MIRKTPPKGKKVQVKIRKGKWKRKTITIQCFCSFIQKEWTLVSVMTCYFKNVPFYTLSWFAWRNKRLTKLAVHYIITVLVVWEGAEGKHLRLKNNSQGPIIHLWGIKAEHWFAFWIFAPVNLRVCYCTRPRQHICESSKSSSFAQSNRNHSLAALVGSHSPTSSSEQSDETSETLLGCGRKGLTSE